MKRILIGIDPDTDKSGVAILRGGRDLELLNISFFKLFYFLKSLKNPRLMVYIECGYLNKSNWHLDKRRSVQSNMETARRTGENHQVAKKIVEMCEYLGIEHEKIKPTTSKVDAKAFNSITGYEGRTNQEKRDAAMLIWGRV